MKKTDLLAIINTYIKHSDIASSLQESMKSHPPETNFPAANSNISLSIKTGWISNLLTPMRDSGEDMAAKVVKLFITVVLVMRRQHKN